MKILLILDQIEKFLSRYKITIFLVLSMFILEALIAIRSNVSSIESTTTDISNSTNTLERNLNSIESNISDINHKTRYE